MAPDCAGELRTVREWRPSRSTASPCGSSPAGHILGSAQVVLDWHGQRAVVSGDYKRAADPTCAPFELVPCDCSSPRRPSAAGVPARAGRGARSRRLLASVARQPERTHLLGVYSLGKCQRMIALAREAGYDRPIYLHGALVALCDLYASVWVSSSASCAT